MSFGRAEAESFFSPLVGKSTTFMVKSRGENLALARLILSAVSAIGATCTILDVDALYSSNPDATLSGMTWRTAARTTVVVPEPGGAMEVEVARLSSCESSVVVVDSLNSLYHLFEGEDTRSRKLSFGVAALTYSSRASGKATILTAYGRKTPHSSGRSISDLSDCTVLVRAAGHDILLKCVRGSLWSGGTLSLRGP